MRIQVLLDFQKGTYAEIEKFCKNVVVSMDGIPKYAAEQPLVDIVKPLLTTYIDAVAAAENGGKLFTAAKKQAKADLLPKMVDIAIEVQQNAKGDESYATEACFKTKKKSVRGNAKKPLPRPEWKYLKRGVQSGTLVGEVQDMPDGVNEMGIYHSTDGWKTMENGTNSSGKKFTLTGLVPEQPVEVKICFHGTFQRKSDLSDSKRIMVL